MSRLFDELHCVHHTSTFVSSYADWMEGSTGSAGVVYTDVFNIGKYKKVAFVIQMGAGASGDGVVTVQSCDDTTPGNTQVVAFHYKVSTTSDVFGDWTYVANTGFTTTAGANACYIIEVDASEMYSTYNYVRCVVTEDTDSATDGCILTILGQPRQMLENPPTAIA